MKSKTTLPAKDQGHIFLKRLELLKKRMVEEGCDVCVIDNPLDLLYLTGLQFSVGRLLVHANETLLYVDSRYIQAAQEKAPVKVVLETKDALSAFFKQHLCTTLFFDGKHTSYDQFMKLTELLDHKEVKIVANTSFFKLLRSVKGEQELHKMRKSAELLWRGLEFIKGILVKGIRENEVAKKFEIFCLENGAEKLSFEPIIAFGPNSAMPHYRAQDTQLREGDVVLIDIGVVVDNYHSDMTRVFFFTSCDPVLDNLYRVNKAAHQAAVALCKPGESFGALDRAAREVMKQAGVEELFVHSLGHGIGLETHEYPIIRHNGTEKDVVMQPGMVFTIEPGLYLAGKGGVRYEDTVMITATGYENFYPDAGPLPIIIRPHTQEVY